jgi:hypothetical protein
MVCTRVSSNTNPLPAFWGNRSGSPGALRDDQRTRIGRSTSPSPACVVRGSNENAPTGLVVWARIHTWQLAVKHCRGGLRSFLERAEGQREDTAPRRHRGRAHWLEGGAMVEEANTAGRVFEMVLAHGLRASRKTSTYCSVRRIWCCMQAWSGHTGACLRPIPRGRLQGTWLPATPLKNGSPWSFAFKTYVVPYAPLASCVGLQPIGP